MELNNEVFSDVPLSSRIRDQEHEVRLTLERFCKAVRDVRLEVIMEFYAEDVRGLDMMAPLLVKGRDRYQANWRMFCDRSLAPMGYDFVDLDIRVSGPIAFVSGLLHMYGQSRGEGPIDMWIQYSAGLTNESGKWQFMVEHCSVPIDMETGQALFDLNPEGRRH